MKKYVSVFFVILLSMSSYLYSQRSVDIDGRLQPLLDDFFEQCKKYGIDYHAKLFQLKSIDIVDNLPLEEKNTVLGKVSRNVSGEVDQILISWVAMLDSEILKVVAFHEFAHHFLNYKHTCQDCNEIMAVTNTSYFAIARDWENQVEILFINSPIYLANKKVQTVAVNTFN